MKSNDKSVIVEKPFASYTDHLRDQAALQVLNGMVGHRIPADNEARASYAALAYLMADALLARRAS